MSRYQQQQQQDDKIRLSQHQHTFGINNIRHQIDQPPYNYSQQYKPSSVQNQLNDPLNDEPFSIRQILMRLDQLESQAKNQEFLEQKVHSLEQEVQLMKKQEQKYEKLNQQIEQFKSSLEARIMVFDEKIVALSTRVDSKLNNFLSKIQDQIPQVHQEDIDQNGQSESNNDNRNNIKQNDYINEINNLYKLVRKNLQAQKELFEELNLVKKALINHGLIMNIPSKLPPFQEQLHHPQQQTPPQQNIQQNQRIQSQPLSQQYNQQHNGKQEQYPDLSKSFAASSDNYYKQKPQPVQQQHQEKSQQLNKSALVESDNKNNNRYFQQQQPKLKETFKLGDEIKSPQGFDIINFKQSKKGSVDYSIKYNEKSDKKRDTLNLSQSLPKNKLNLSGTYQNSSLENTQEIQKIEKQSQFEFEERKRKIDEEINRRIQQENARREQVIVQDKENTTKIQENQKKEQFKNTPLGTEKSREKEILNRLNLERRMKDEKIQLYSGIQKQNNNQQHSQQFGQNQSYLLNNSNHNNSNLNYYYDQRDSKSPLRMKTLQ